MNIHTITTDASSSVRKIHFVPNEDEETGTLEVTFVNGKTYAYAAVPVTVFETLLDAATSGSAGAAVNRLVVKGGYEYEQVERG